MVDNEDIGAYIANKRKQHKLTQKQLAQQLFVTNKAVSKWETGEGLPDIVSLNALAKTFGITIENILDASDDKLSNSETDTHKQPTTRTNEQQKFDKSLRLQKNITKIKNKIEIQKLQNKNNETLESVNTESGGDEVLEIFEKPPKQETPLVKEEPIVPIKKKYNVTVLMSFINIVFVVILGVLLFAKVFVTRYATINMMQFFLIGSYYPFKLTALVYAGLLSLVGIVNATLLILQMLKISKFNNKIMVLNFAMTSLLFGTAILNFIVTKNYFNILYHYNYITCIICGMLLLTTGFILLHKITGFNLHKKQITKF